MSTPRLSPLNFSGLIGTMRLPFDVDLPGSRVVEVTFYRCTECDELHEDEADAEKCCPPGPRHTRLAMSCPVCAGDGFKTYEQATDCCLWKDIPFAERRRIAAALDAGSSWLDQLGVSRTRVVIQD